MKLKLLMSCFSCLHSPFVAVDTQNWIILLFISSHIIKFRWRLWPLFCCDKFQWEKSWLSAAEQQLKPVSVHEFLSLHSGWGKQISHRPAAFLMKESSSLSCLSLEILINQTWIQKSYSPPEMGSCSWEWSWGKGVKRMRATENISELMRNNFCSVSEAWHHYLSLPRSIFGSKYR